MKKKNKKSGNKKPAGSKSRVSPKAKLSAKSRAKKASTKRKPVPRRKSPRENDVMGSQSVETVPLSAVRQKARSARAGSSGGGGGDYSGLSPVEGADSESPRELLEEAQTLEPGIVEGVQNAPNADQGECRTARVQRTAVPRSATIPD